jgi:hypothetical protein
VREKNTDIILLFYEGTREVKGMGIKGLARHYKTRNRK